MSIFYTASLFIFCYCSVAQLCLTLCDPMDCSTPGFPVLHYPWSLLKLTSIASRMPSNLCCPHLLLPSIFSSIRVFSNELALLIRWPKYWSFNFSIIPSNEYLELVSFRIDWFDLLAIQGTLQESSPAPQFKSIEFSALSLFDGPTLN